MNSSENSGPLNRARQSTEHLRLKQQVGVELQRLGFEVMYEFRLADVVGFHLDSGTIVAVEVELSSKNVAANLLRNLRHGFKIILIVVPPQQVGRTKALVDRNLPPTAPKETIRVSTIDDVRGTLSKVTKK